MKFITRLFVILFVFFCLAIAFISFTHVTSASSCIAYKNGNGYHLRYKKHTYVYDHVGKVASTDIHMSGECPLNGIPAISNQTQNSTPTITTQQKEIDEDKKEDSKKNHPLRTEKTTTVNQTVNNTYTTNNNTYVTNQTEENTQYVNTSDLQINQQYPVGLYELQRFSVNGYCLGGHCYVLDHCSMIVIDVNQDVMYCLNN